jgi:hypothetical protein
LSLSAPALNPVQGESLLLALYTQNDWIIRTVERVKFVDHNTVRRHIIRHFRLPKYPEARPKTVLPAGLEKQSGRCILPVFTLPKGSFVNCDLRDASGRKIALRPIEERWGLTYQAMFSVLLRANSKATDDQKLRSLVWDVVSTTHSRADDALRALGAYPTALKRTLPDVSQAMEAKDFRELSAYLAWNYLVFADISLVSDQDHMISYMMDERFADRLVDFQEVGMRVASEPAQKQQKGARLRKQLGLMPHTYFHPWPISGAGSSHLEIKAPEGVAFGARELKLPNRAFPLRHPGTSARYARFLAPRSVGKGEGFARIDVHPGSGVMRTAGPMIGALFTFLLVIVAACGVKASLAATLLLILPSFASVVAARPGEHPYVSRVVRGVRYLTLFPILLSALAVTVLAAEMPRWFLVVLIAMSILFTGVLWIGARRLKVNSARVDLVKKDLTRVA